VSFSAGLLEAACQATIEQWPVLLVAFDFPFPAPLYAVHSVEHSFAAAFLLTTSRMSDALMKWDISLEQRTRSSAMPEMLPKNLYGNAAARCLPLLQALARQFSGTIWLDYLSGYSIAVRCE
jgi:hypothetical protein